MPIAAVDIHTYKNPMDFPASKFDELKYKHQIRQRTNAHGKKYEKIAAKQRAEKKKTIKNKPNESLLME